MVVLNAGISAPHTAATLLIPRLSANRPAVTPCRNPCSTPSANTPATFEPLPKFEFLSELVIRNLASGYSFATSLTASVN